MLTALVSDDTGVARTFRDRTRKAVRKVPTDEDPGQLPPLQREQRLLEKVCFRSSKQLSGQLFRQKRGP